MLPTPYEQLVLRSRSLPYEAPTGANRLEALRERADEVEEHASAVRPILMERTHQLISDFLAHKSSAGSRVEQRLYEGMSEQAFISRLFARRPLTFMGSEDYHLLPDGTKSQGGFDLIGSEQERPPYCLKNLLSYDEMGISALLGLSIPTHFINRGDRQNEGRPGHKGTFEARGIYTGLVGARFERSGRMEWRQMLLTPQQRSAGSDFGPTSLPEGPGGYWARFYGLPFLPTWSEAIGSAPGRYVAIRDDLLLDTLVFRSRIQAVLEPFLLDANERAEQVGRRAYVHVVGLGLGVWKVSAAQHPLFIEALAEVLRTRALPHIADVDFSWFGDSSSCGGVRDGELWEEGENRLRIHFSQRDPAEPLSGQNEGKLLVAMYAWDSNSLPGNEYWIGSLSASGDPAAACCSTIGELGNPAVNPIDFGEAARVFSDSD